MGCAQSRIDNEESVSRCKERKILMKEALLARSSFAVAHSAYAIALKNAGSALSDYAHGESSAPDPLTSAAPSATTAAAPPPPPPPPPEVVVAPPSPPPQEPLPPPPPPLPPLTPSPLQRSVTMPELSKRRVSNLHDDDEEEEEEGRTPEIRDTGKMGMAWDYFVMSPDHFHGSGLGEIDEEDEHEEDEDEEEEDEKVGRRFTEDDFRTPEKAVRPTVVPEEEVVVETRPPPPEMGVKHFVHSNTAPAEVGRMMSNKGESESGNKVNLMKVLEEIDECFLKASECAQEVTKLLEAHKLQYHSSYADSRVPVDHAARVMRVITWNRALQSAPGGGKDEYEDNETLATVLDKLMAWEKKLYEEVKASELMKLEYHRKVALLNRQKKRGANGESLEKTKAAVSHLHTRYIVDMQSMDSTVAEVNELRDQQLYPKLVELVNGMAKMWENICIHHDTQLNIATKLKTVDVSLAARETSKHHRQCTVQLANVVQQWQEHFETLVNHQKLYVRALHSWLKLNLIPIESNLKEKTVSSPPRAQNPPIQALLHAWHDSLQKLPDEVTRTAISSFGAVIRTIMLHQDEEMKLKESCEELRREYMKKNQAFKEWYHKQMQRKGPEFAEAERGEDGTARDPVGERRFVVDSLKKRLDDEVEKYQRHCVQVRDKSLGTLKTRLPELFRALSEYAHASSDAYNKMRAIVLSQGSNGVSS